MKKSIFITACLMLASIVSAQTSEIQSVAEGFQNGNASEISACFGDEIEMIILSTSGTFSKQKAASMLSDFFRRNTVQRFNLVHKGASGDSSFGTGNLTTQNGDFRVYFLFRKEKGENVIKILRIEAK